MATKVMIPMPLRAYTKGKDSIVLEGKTVGELLDALARTYVPIRNHLYDERGELRGFVNVYVNDEDIRSLQKERTAVSEADVVSIIPSIAGGNT